VGKCDVARIVLGRSIFTFGVLNRGFCMAERSALWAILVGGGIAGLLDIIFAISFAAYGGATPTRLLQTVASGLFGKFAFTGGVQMAALGLALHFAMSLAWAGVFYLLACRVPLLVQQPLLSGIVFGVIVFLIMRLVVLPLSAFPFPVNFPPLGTTLDVLSHAFLFGLPIAWCVRKAIAV
jgi:uncharacterized membrane protein YagU involved in acid resistance